MADANATGGGVDLGAYQWRNRLFLLFAPSRDDAEYRRQRELIADQERAFADRDLLVGDLFEGAPGALGDRTLSAADAADVRMRLGVPGGGFTAVLVGKDGGAKNRFQRPIAPDDLYALIDAMPMRRQERQERDQ